MKKTTITLALLSALSLMTSVQASEFDGLFVGGKVGNNNTDISGGTLATSSTNTTTWGIDEGYNWDMDSYLLGADFFVNINHEADHAASPESYSSSVMGLGLKLGVPMNSWLPYVHVGYAKIKGGFDASTISGYGLVGGVGVEYKFTPNWGANAEWSSSSATNNGSNLNNDNITLGIRYYFGAPAAAPTAAPEAVKEAPFIAPAPAPVAKSVPAPQPKENWKTVITEKPVRLEGANFATGSADLLETADAKLSEVLNAAKQYPEVMLEVSGHTDNQNKKGLNQELSENRAAAVKSWLVKHGVAAGRINTAGYADTQPIADNKTQEGRAANRRVEVRYVIKEEKKVRVNE